MTGKSKRRPSSGQGPIIDTRPCEELSFIVQLVSPQPDVVGTLAVNEVLAVGMETMKGLTVIQVAKNGQPVGGFPSGEGAALRNCIRQGHRYKATVLTVNTGQVTVRIEHV